MMERFMKHVVWCLAVLVGNDLSPQLYAQLNAAVEIQINSHPGDPEADVAADDYLTWAPTVCRARLINATTDLDVVLTNDVPGYYLFVGGNNLRRGCLEVGDQFICRVDAKELRVDAGSTDPEAIATQIVAAWNASSVEEFQRFSAVASNTAIIIAAKSAADHSKLTLSTRESDGQVSDGQTFVLSTKGDVLFAAFEDPWPAAKTATEASIQLQLKKDGTWQPFIVAGKFGRPSTDDKDAVIIAHKENVTGDMLGEARLMVRVRKNANGMGKTERDRFLQAMRIFRNKPTGGFLTFQELHRLATTAGDEAHHQPAFFPWHRTLLLQVERELQIIDPSVSLPFWDWDDAAPSIFSEEFMGAPGGDADDLIAEPVFELGHPFTGWTTDLPFSSGALRRSTSDHAVKPLDAGFPIIPLSTLASFDDYSQENISVPNPDQDATSFSVAGERLSHDLGHAWACASGHLTRPMRSACDPLFYLLHCQVDRQWAYWQRAKNRFGVVVGGSLTFPIPGHYDNSRTFDTPGNMPSPSIDIDHTRQKGSYLDDGLWPWDGTSGGAALALDQRPVNREPPRDSGIAQAGGAVVIGGNSYGTLTLRNGASASDGAYESYELTITGGAGSGQSVRILRYTGTTRTAIVGPAWTNTPDATSTYAIYAENVPSSEPTIPMAKFPASRIRHLWPSAAIVPRVRHMIDYLGRNNPSDGLGFCYEDVPYDAP